ncbi:EamA family transporter RarD [Desulfovibrio litoralis]|uniref:Chloramphenicol-sensitive protein RarD n=1 Tax=Desulfovibrio litoralis DSM 11393 TaxID=1121455 RepID=A0A1M7RX62_9BACT|nr:EamA family transporter RarD [Desulfovibrio litoralis]SHN50865.1 chloramphenicol-sensitive protein RarD [Desulfovibrio litoralis DSM 11393]
MQETVSKANPPLSSRLPWLAAFGSFFIWGALPIYWHALDTVNSLEILAHRIFWSFIFLFFILLWRKEVKKSYALLKNNMILLSVFTSGGLLTFNWLLYIWAVTHNQIIDASLGYFITPLINVVLGVIFFKNKLNRVQSFAIVIAACGVFYQLYAQGTIPIVGLSLAISFSFYGMMRKKVAVESLPGLFLETTIFAIPAFLWLIFLQIKGSATFFHVPSSIHLLLIFSGVITSVPLLMYAYAARQMSFVSLGLIQYVTPSLAFLVGFFIFKETFNIHMAITFLCIWTALAIYTADSLYTFKRRLVINKIIS